MLVGTKMDWDARSGGSRRSGRFVGGGDHGTAALRRRGTAGAEPTGRHVAGAGDCLRYFTWSASVQPSQIARRANSGSMWRHSSMGCDSGAQRSM